MCRRLLFIIAATLPLFYCFDQRYAIAQTGNSWTAPIRIQIGNHNFDLSFGVNPNATAGFDDGVDIITAPPPPATPYAYFSLAVFPNFLQADRRGPNNSISWNLRIMNTGGASSTVSWDVSQVPTSVNKLSIVSLSETVNMLQTPSKTYVGDQSLQIILNIAPPLTANAGADRSLLYALTTTLGGSPTASGGTPPYTYSWSPMTGLDNPNAANPMAKATSTTTHTVTVTDANHATATDQVVITVQSFVLLSDGYLKINQNKDSKGDIHSNSKLEFQPGAPGTHIGNLTAKSDIAIQTKNTIQGNATAGDNLYLFGTAKVTGTKKDHANVAIIPLPAYSYSAGGSNITVPNNGTQTLAPGSYGEVRVKNKATLKLSAGNYYMNVLNCDPNAILSINAAPQSGANIYVVKDFQFGNSAQVKLTAGSSDKVLFVTLQSQKVNVGNSAILYGTLVLPKAQVQFLNSSKIKGAVYASSISIDSLVKFYHHTSPGTFP